MGGFELNAGDMLLEQPLTIVNNVLAGLGSDVRSVIVYAAETVTGFESSERIIADCLSCPWLSGIVIFARDICPERSFCSW